MAVDVRSPLSRRAFFGRWSRAVAARSTAGWEEKIAVLLALCHPWQRDFVQDRSRLICALVGARGGKTTGGRARFFVRMMRTKRARCLFIAKSREDARELIWEKLKETVGELGLQDEVVFQEQRLVMTFKRNRSFLKLVGADDQAEIDKLRGKPWHEVGIDEAASMRPELLENLIIQVLGPRLGDYKGTLWVVGTPGHILRGYFYDLTKEGSEKSRPYREMDKHPGWTGWTFHAWNVQDAAPYAQAIANAWEDALLQKLNEGWSDDNPIWRRERLGKWAADDTRMVFRYSVERNRWKPAEKDRHGVAVLPPPRGRWHFVVGMDLGHSDPTAVEVLAWDDGDTGKNLWHVFEFYQRGVYARILAVLFLGADLNANVPTGLFESLGWPDGMVADVGRGGGESAELAELANVYGLAIEPAKEKDRHDSIELFNGDLLDGRIHVLEGSKLEEQLLGLQWEIDKWGLPEKNKRQRDDAADGGMYARKIAWHLSSTEPVEKHRKLGKFESVGRELEVRSPAPEFSEFVDLTETFTHDDADYWG